MSTEEIEATEATTTEVVAPAEISDEAAFDAAFDEATLVLDDTPGDAADDNVGVEGSAAEDTGDTDGGDVDDGTGADVDGTDDTAGATGAADPTGDESGTADPAATADAPTARELELQAQLDALQAATKPVVEPEATVEAPQPEPTLTEDEVATVAAYREEWGDVAKAEALIRKEENQVIVGYVFDQMKTVLAPLLAAHETRNGRDQYTDLVGLVPDYDEVRDKMVDWVDKLPDGINKRIYTEVTKTGTPDEVADMIKEFKKATAYEPITTSTAAPVAKTAPATAAVSKQAATGAAPKPNRTATASLRVVNTVRSKTNTGGPDMNDFEGSFDEFAQKK